MKKKKRAYDHSKGRGRRIYASGLKSRSKARPSPVTITASRWPRCGANELRRPSDRLSEVVSYRGGSTSSGDATEERVARPAPRPSRRVAPTTLLDGWRIRQHGDGEAAHVVAIGGRPTDRPAEDVEGTNGRSGDVPRLATLPKCRSCNSRAQSRNRFRARS